MTTPIRVLVADDHTIVRTGIRHVLEGESEFELVGEAANGSEALTLAERLRPDVIVVDISMPGESGLRLAARVRTSLPETRVLILSMHDNAEYVVESLRAGANGYLLKDAAATELRHFLPQRDRRARVVACACRKLDTDAVSLLLGFAAVRKNKHGLRHGAG